MQTSHWVRQRGVLNEQAARELSCEHQVEIVPGASHLFEEPGKLEQVADLARNWFPDKLQSSSA